MGKNKYLKIFIWLLTWLTAYFIIANRNLAPFRDWLISLGYIGAFITGMMYSYSFTAGPATGFLIVFGHSQNIWLLGLTAGLGAATSDLTIFKFVRLSFKKEIFAAQHSKLMMRVEKTSAYLRAKAPRIFKKFVLPFIAAIIIASPLPNEIGVGLMAAVVPVNTKTFLVISYLLNLLGIFAILLIGHKI